MTDQPIVVAIDGPAGSGKSTVARAVAERVAIDYLDTGAMYRGVAFAVLRDGVDPAVDEEVAPVAAAVTLDLGEGWMRVDGVDVTDAIRTPEVTRAVSMVAAQVAVRERLVELQREWVLARGGGVVEGRDIGSVVFPNAFLKIYLTASIAERARRRAAETGLNPAEVEAEMIRRDEADSTREESPLVQAGDATLVDTTGLTITEVVEKIADLLDERLAEAGRERPAP